MSESIVKSPPALSGLSLNRRAIITVSAVIVLVLAFVISSAFAPHAERPKSKNTQPATQLAGSLAGVADDYSRIPRTKVTLPEVPERVAIHDSSDMEKLLARLAAEKLERQGQARKSAVSFKEVGVHATPSSTSALAGSQDETEKGLQDPRDSANRQDDKLRFLETARRNGTDLFEPLKHPFSPYQLSAGTIVPGVLLTGINSDLPGQIMGQVSQNVFDSKEGAFLLIPQGTKVVGSYDSRISYGQERVLIVWTRLLFPNGDSLSLQGMPGVDLSGYAGLSDQVNNHYLKLLTGVIFGSALGAGAQIADGPQSTLNPSYSQLALQGFAKNTNDVGQQLTRRNLEIQPTLEIRPGKKFSIFVTKDITLKPYEE